VLDAIPNYPLQPKPYTTGQAVSWFSQASQQWALQLRPFQTRALQHRTLPLCLFPSCALQQALPKCSLLAAGCPCPEGLLPAHKISQNIPYSQANTSGSPKIAACLVGVSVRVAALPGPLPADSRKNMARRSGLDSVPAPRI